MALIEIKTDEKNGVALSQSTTLPGYWVSVRDRLGNWHNVVYGATREIADADFLYVVSILAVRGPCDCVRGQEPEAMEQSR